MNGLRIMSIMLALGAASPSLAAEAGNCARLASGSWPDTAIVQVESVPANSVRPFGAGNLPTGAAGADAVSFLPAHCLLRGQIGRRPSTIAGNTLGNGFELRMPDAWNGRFFFQGGGGWDGWLRQASGVILSGTADRASALARGFAVVSTDAGHISEMASPATDGRFADDLKARTDNAVDAVIQTTAVAKQIVTAYYGKPIERSYFVGCSNGGREGMLEAQLRPEDYDGIVSGDPAFDLTAAAIAWDWNERALTAIAPKDQNGKPELWKALTDADLTLLADATAQACGSADSGTAGQCHFDLGTLLCKDAASTNCLTAPKIRAIEAIQHGVADSAGHPLYAAWTQGGEAGPAGWRAWMLGTDRIPARAQAFVADWMRHVAVMPGQTPIDWQAFDYDHDPARIAGPTAPWQATGTDYAAFAKRGGRILFYQGGSDPAFSAIRFEQYYAALAKAAGGTDQASAFSRLFLVPSMAHCSGGPAFDQFDPLQAITDWVEQGRAPERLVARGAQFAGATRPLCAYPLVARYDGTGDRADAASYRCAP